MKLSTLLVLTILAGIVIFSAISFLAGFNQIYDVLQKANYWYIVLAIGFQLLSVTAVFLRWDMVIRYCKMKIAYSRLFLITLAGIAFSHLMPSSRMGGEPLRAYFLKKDTGKNISLCFSTIIAERIFDAVTFSVISLFVLISIFLFWSLPAWVMALLLIAFLLTMLILFLMVFISINKRSAMKLVKWSFKVFSRFLSRWKNISSWERKIEKDVTMYSENVSRLIRKRKLWLYGLSFSLLAWLFDIFRIYFIFLAFGSNVSLIVIGVTIVIAALAGTIPISPGGLGLIEAAMLIVFAAAGIPIAIAGMVTIMDRLISYWGLSLTGLASSYYLGIKKYRAKA